jgi:dolichyl-phosphate-mannose--protein O-mannosyl transferase
MFQQAKQDLGTADTFIVFVLSIGAFFTRIWLQAEPNHVVFDEIYFGNFSSEYLLGNYFFDIHPPLGKLTMAFFAWLAEYPATFDFESHFAKRYDDEEYLIMRLIPEIASSLVVPLIYLTMRLMNFSIIASFTAGAFALFENSLVTEGRLILSDGVLHFMCCLHVIVLVQSIRRQPSIKWLIYCGLSLGAACSCKNTAWGLTALAGICHAADAFVRFGVGRKFFFDVLTRGLIIGFLTVFVYFVSFVIHFEVLPYSGPGCDFLSEDLRVVFLAPGSDFFAQRVQPPWLIARVIWLVLDMHNANMGISNFHDYESRPLSWPLLTSTHTAFWVDETGNRQVNCNGNMYIYAMVFYAVIVLSLCAPVNRNWGYLVILFGYYISYLPFFLIKRAMFLYHYHIPLFFACMAFGAVMDLLCNTPMSVAVSVVAIGAAWKGFMTWYPFVYGTLCPDWTSLEWDSRWTVGDAVHQSLAAIDSAKKQAGAGGGD